MLGFYAATSPNIAPKIIALNYGYIVAWAIVYGLPSTFLIWLALRKRKFHREEKVREMEMQVTTSEKTFYGESYPELDQEEAQLQEIQEIEADVKDKDETNMAQIGQTKMQLPEVVDQVRVENVYIIDVEQPKTTIEVEKPFTKPAANMMRTFTCRICEKRISKSEYLKYDGMRRLCWIKERRRSGLFGADRASTW